MSKKFDDSVVPYRDIIIMESNKNYVMKLRKILIAMLVMMAIIPAISNDLLALSAKRYVTVEYLPCANGNHTRSETWYEGSADNEPVYSHFTDCDGKVTESGKKPLTGNDGGLWESAQNYQPIEDWVYEVATTFVSQTETSITITTDSDIQAQMVNLYTGLPLTKLIEIGSDNSYTFDTSNLSFDCIYSIVVQQYIPEAEDTFIIRNHNFCKKK
jgi:hypothetical protein